MKAEEFQLKIGLKFKNPEFLIEALTHPSYLNESSTPIGGSYQRLEFLGDAILGSVVSLEIFKRYPFEEIKAALQSHLNPEDTPQEGDIIDDDKPSKTNYALNTNSKKSKSDEFDELFSGDDKKEDDLPF